MDTPKISRETVLDTAMRIVEEHGLAALSMRRLAAELGVAVTGIWHVGNREVLIGQLVERVVGRLGDITATGHTPEQRIVAVGHQLRRLIHDHPHMIALVYEHGQTALMMLPAERALAREIGAAGLRGTQGALAVRAVLHHVVGHVLLERAVSRSPEQHPSAAELWDGELGDGELGDGELGDGEVGTDAALAEALSAPLDPDRVFDLSLLALVRGLLTQELLG
jgi:AcrR family transcriptional regulator